MTRELISVVLPVYNEADNIAECLRRLRSALGEHDHEILICYDFEEDTTLTALAEMADRPPTVRLVKNDLGRGAAFAMRSGFRAAEGDVIVTTMADLSDPPEIIPEMARKIREEGADVVSGSRYMKGGSQTGGPLLKRIFSRAAGLSLCWVGGIATRDATNNFRAYSRRLIDAVKVRSEKGFELALELTVKAHLGGFKVAEVPSTWVDRSAGESRFRMWRWLPVYLKWYLRALAAPLFVWAVLAAATLGAFYLVGHYGPDVPWWDEFEHVPYVTGERPVTAGWLWEAHKVHRIALPKLVYIALAGVSGSHFKAGMAFNVLVMSAIAFAFILAARRIRGRMAATDAFFPLAWLHWGHAETMLWGFQVQFTLSALFFCAAVIAVSRRGRELKAAQVLVVGTSVVLLPLCGAQGLLLAGPLVLWLLVVAGVAVRARGRTRAGRLAPVALAFAAVAIVVGGLYFAGLERGPGPDPPPATGELTAGVAEFLSGSFGPVARCLWPLFAVLTAALLGTAAVLLVRSTVRKPEERLSAVGLLMMLAAVVLLAIGIAQGRVGKGPHVGLRARYIVASLPALCCVYLVFVRQSKRRAFRVIVFLLFAIALAGFQQNSANGLVFAKWRRQEAARFRRDAAAGMSSKRLARRHREAFYGHQSEEGFAEQIEMLRRAGIGPFPQPARQRD
ncbi:MAG: glycosyltransferase [Planctomycetota bacterium]|jgi:glycosyltransferase involved in cell wall biosynthesis